MESGTFQTPTEVWNWSVIDLTGPPRDRVVAKSFRCVTSAASHTISMERELSLDFGPIDDGAARKLLVHADTCSIRGDKGTRSVQINRIAEHRPFHEAQLGGPAEKTGRLRVAVRGCRPRRLAVSKPLGEHAAGELLEIVREASAHRRLPAVPPTKAVGE